MLEIHGQSVGSLLPGTAFGPWDFAVPLHHVDGLVYVLGWLGYKAVRVVASPFLSLFLQSVDDHVVDLLLFIFVHGSFVYFCY